MWYILKIELEVNNLDVRITEFHLMTDVNLIYIVIYMFKKLFVSQTICQKS